MEAARETLSRVHNHKAQALLPSSQTIRQAWEASGLDWKHSVIQLLVEKIEVLPGSPGSRMYRGWRFNPEQVRVAWKA